MKDNLCRIAIFHSYYVYRNNNFSTSNTIEVYNRIVNIPIYGGDYNRLFKWIENENDLCFEEYQNFQSNVGHVFYTSDNRCDITINDFSMVFPDKSDMDLHEYKNHVFDVMSGRKLKIMKLLCTYSV